MTFESAINNPDELNKLASEKVKLKNYYEGIELYSEAIELDPSKAVYYSNRSFCYEKVESYGLAVGDATKAIEIDPNMIKAYFRRAIANLSVGHLKLALDDFTYLFKKFPRERTISERYKYCSSKYREQLLAKAIEYVEKSAFDIVDLESLSLQDSGCELKIEEDQITLEFAIKLMNFLKDDKRLSFKELYKLLSMARSALKQKNSLVRYEIPKLFNGDFVDRGSFSVEVITLLLTFHVLYPNHFLLNRGNHETASMNEMYGFKDEVLKKYSKTIYNIFIELFQYLPVAHLIDNSILVMHGGLPSNDNHTLEDIEKISRFREPNEGSLMFDLLWTDPTSQQGRIPNPRGVTTAFGPDVTKAFCTANNLRIFFSHNIGYIIRSHESQMEGYSMSHEGQCITIFSAPNYWFIITKLTFSDEMGNKGAFIHLTKNLNPEFHQFEASVL
ncbi:hypothetical protein HZS_6889, partial [Henneguya salminicola]